MIPPHPTPPHPPPAPARLPRPRRPRRTVRLRLTLLYGTMFLVCGAALLTITYILADHEIPSPVMVRSSTEPGAAGPSTGPGAAGGSGTSGSIQTFCAAKTSGPAQLPGTLPGTPSGTCRQLVAALGEQRSAELGQLLTDSGIALGIMAVVSIGLGWLIAGRVLRPLRTITAAAQRVSASNLNQRLALTGPDDELRELGETFNALLARLEASFGAQRQFVANASHELRTPLARQRTLVEVALADPQRSAGSLLAACERVLAAGEQQERLIEGLLTLARSQRGLDQHEPLDLRATAAEVLHAHEAEARRRGLRVGDMLSPAVTAGDPRLVERLAVNLVDNALRHNVAGGWVEVTTGMRGGQPVLAVASSGPVVDPGDVGRLFEPFQRRGGRGGTAGVRDGHGLGLSIVAAIAAAHDARLNARALAGGGLEVEVCFRW